MKNLQSFSEFVNESNESETINEGLTAEIYKIGKKDKTIFGLDWDPSMKKICSSN